MVDQNDRHQDLEHDDLYDDAAPRSVFAATWFRAVLVLIVLGVIGAVAVPYILDAMNAPPPKTAATKPPATTPAPAPPIAAPQVAPPQVATPTASASSPTPTQPSAPSSTAPAGGNAAVGKAGDATVAASTTAPEGAKSDAAKPENAAPEAAKPEGAKPDNAKPDATTPKSDSAPTKPAPPARTPTRVVSTPSKRAPAGQASGQWFVQVGAFKDPATAKRVAAKLRADSYHVDEPTRGGTPAAMVASATTTAPAAADRYDVIVTGATPADLGQRLAGKNLTVETTSTGAVIKPSLPLRDAVALSKDLAVDGLKVQVRRAGGPAAPTAAPSGAASSGGDALYRVSVGGFADRATALSTLKELEGKGYKPFLTRR
jgi:cell division septation protein DedD